MKKIKSTHYTDRKLCKAGASKHADRKPLPKFRDDDEDGATCLIIGVNLVVIDRYHTI